MLISLSFEIYKLFASCGLVSECTWWLAFQNSYQNRNRSKSKCFFNSPRWISFKNIWNWDRISKLYIQSSIPYFANRPHAFVPGTIILQIRLGIHYDWSNLGEQLKQMPVVRLYDYSYHSYENRENDQYTYFISFIS